MMIGSMPDPLRPTTRHSLHVDPATGRAHLAVAGSPLARVAVDGSVLEAQLETPAGDGLVFLTEDSPYDEALHVYLLSPEGAIEDALEASATFSAGTLELVRLGVDDVDLRFFRNDVVYRLSLGPPGLRLAAPAGWRYKRRLARHQLAVHALAQEDPP